MLKQVAAELREIGLTPSIVTLPQFLVSPEAILFKEEVKTGRYKGQQLPLCLSFQENTYPEYPPHFVHLESTLETNIATRHSEHYFNGQKWFAYSLPPSDFWDSLEPSQKNMKTYYFRHLIRIFTQL